MASLNCESIGTVSMEDNMLLIQPLFTLPHKEKSDHVMK
jgi:hypothetical protein